MMKGGACGRASNLNCGQWCTCRNENGLGTLIRRRPADLAHERSEAITEASPIKKQATQHLDKVARPSQATAKADRAQTPATAEQERSFLAVGLKCFFSQQRRGCFNSQEAVKDRRNFLFALEA